MAVVLRHAVAVVLPTLSVAVFALRQVVSIIGSLYTREAKTSAQFFEPSPMSKKAFFLYTSFLPPTYTAFTFTFSSNMRRSASLPISIEPFLSAAPR